jgi:ubiquinone/menaquinone biosynthesis C-methylase UbiE
MSDDDRKRYWNGQYLEYWRSRVDEAGVGKSKVISGDSNTEDDSVYERVFNKYGFNAGNLLDVGCAWGRMFPIYKRFGLKITGVDISKAMIDAAKENWHGEKLIHQLLESSAEALPFADRSFDNLACLAVLDATFQNQAIGEFLRVTKPGARIYFTGKNDHYYPSDLEAYNAEIGARRKCHPNFFTDTKLLIQLLKEQGHKVDQFYFFPRRGDFASFTHEEIPERFYEYFLVITRGDSCSDLPVISDVYSKTFKELNS